MSIITSVSKMSNWSDSQTCHRLLLKKWGFMTCLGRKEHAIIHELTSSGEKVKKTIQSWYLPISLKEAHHLLKSEHENGSVGFSKFWLKATECQDIWSKLVDQIPPASNVAGTATKYQ